MPSFIDARRRSLAGWILAGGLTALASCGAPPRSVESAPQSSHGASPPAATTGSTGSALPSGSPGTNQGTLATLDRDVARLALPADRVRTTYDVSLTPETVVLDSNAAAALRSFDPKTHSFRFDRATLGAVAAQLKPKAVLLIPGKALRRVTRVQSDGADWVVDTEYASLTDAIENGRIGWDAQLSFDRVHAVALLDESGNEVPLTAPRDRSMLGSFAARSLADQSGVIPKGAIVWKFEQAPMTYEFQVEPQGEQVSIKIKAIKKQGKKATLAYTALGVFKNVRSTVDGTITDQKVKSLSYDQSDLEGDITLSIGAAGAGLGKIEFPFPGVMFKFVVMVGPVPVTIGVGAKLIGNITVPATASATAKSRFQYRSSSGFEYQGSDVEVKGNIGTLEFSPQPFDSASMIGIPVDAQWGVAFPRMSISIFDSLFVPYLHTGVVVGSALKWGPICKHGYVKYTSEVGYDFKIFGVSIKSDKVKIAEKEQRAPEGGCPKTK